MSDEPTPVPRTPEETHEAEAKSRNFLIAIIAGVLLIGIVGVAIAVLSGSDDSSSKPIPMKSLDPLSVEGVCRTAHVATYAVVDKKTEFTVTSSVRPWLRKGEVSQTTNVDDTKSLAALGKPGTLPREVLTLKKGATGWSISQTSACLEESKANACPVDVVLTVAGKTYLENGTGDGVTPKAVVGQGSFTPCVDADATGKAYAARGVVAPVTVYRGQVQGTVVANLGSGRYVQFDPKK